MAFQNKETLSFCRYSKVRLSGLSDSCLQLLAQRLLGTNYILHRLHKTNEEQLSEIEILNYYEQIRKCLTLSLAVFPLTDLQVPQSHALMLFPIQCIFLSNNKLPYQR